MHEAQFRTSSGPPVGAVRPGLPACLHAARRITRRQRRRRALDALEWLADWKPPDGDRAPVDFVRRRDRLTFRYRPALPPPPARLRLPFDLPVCRQNPTRQPVTQPRQLGVGHGTIARDIKARLDAWLADLPLDALADLAAYPDVPTTYADRDNARRATRAALERLAADGAIGGYDLAGRGSRQRLTLWRPRPALPAPDDGRVYGDCG